MIRVSEVVNPGDPDEATQSESDTFTVGGEVEFQRPPLTDSTSTCLVPQIRTVTSLDPAAAWMSTPVAKGVANCRSIAPSYQVASRPAGDGARYSLCSAWATSPRAGR